MALFKQLALTVPILVLFLVVGCSQKSEEIPKKEVIKKNILEVFKDKLEQQNKQKSLDNTPEIMLPPAYIEPNLLSNSARISFSSNNVALSKLLLIITKEAGLNLAIDKSVDIDKLITVNMVNISIKDAIDMVMDISDIYFELKGNILYVKKFRTKTFSVPFINMKLTSASSSLGGDILGKGRTNTSGSSGLSGSSRYEYSADVANSDFYQQLINLLDKVKSKEGSYSLNKFSGILTVTDLNSKVKQIENLIKQMAKFINKQVLVDAKIMEVILDDKHQLGINWNVVGELSDGILTFNQAMPVTGSISSLTYTKENFQGIISAMQSSGEIEVVSNPRIKVLNGQIGMLASGSMEPYWEKEISYSEIINAENEKEYIPQVVYNKIDVLDGISLGVTPIIKEDGTVLLNIIPIITNIEGEKIFYDDSKQVASAPIINVKEVGTTVTVKDNEMIVIGGLISSKDITNEYQIPILGDIPVLGLLFQSHDIRHQKRELVIILKINIQKND